MSGRHILGAFAGLALLFVTLGLGMMLGASSNPQYRNPPAIGSAPKSGDGYRGPSDSLPDIAGLPGPIERAIANPRPTSGQDNEKRDLAAQEASAMWAFWMVCAAVATFIVTSFGTILIYQQVKLTREAVEDTGKATKAMERQNELTTLAQRAWVVFEARVNKAEVEGNRFEISVEIISRNIGNSVARDLSIWAKICSSKKLDETISEVRQAVESEDAFVSPLVPGDIKQHWMQRGYSIAHMELDEHSGKAELIIFVAARYSVIGEDDRKIAERAFSLCEAGQVTPFGAHGLSHPIHPLISPGGIKVLPAGKVRAT